MASDGGAAGSLKSAVHMRVATPAEIADRRKLCRFLNELAVLVGQLFRLVTAYPGFKDIRILRCSDSRARLASRTQIRQDRVRTRRYNPLSQPVPEFASSHASSVRMLPVAIAMHSSAAP